MEWRGDFARWGYPVGFNLVCGALVLSTIQLR
jgi:hypothetical protein